MLHTSTSVFCDDCRAIIMTEADGETARKVAADECGAVVDVDGADYCKACAEKRARSGKRGI